MVSRSRPIAQEAPRAGAASCQTGPVLFLGSEPIDWGAGFVWTVLILVSLGGFLALCAVGAIFAEGFLKRRKDREDRS